MYSFNQFPMGFEAIMQRLQQQAPWAQQQFNQFNPMQQRPMMTQGQLPFNMQSLNGQQPMQMQQQFQPQQMQQFQQFQPNMPRMTQGLMGGGNRMMRPPMQSFQPMQPINRMTQGGAYGRF